MGAFRLDVVSQYHSFGRLVHGDDYVSFSELKKKSPEAAEHGDADFRLFQTDLIGRYGLSDRREVFFDVPYKRASIRADIDDEHHRDETFDGLGDVRIGVRHYLRSDESVQLAGIVGLSIPTGRRNKTTAFSYLDHDEADTLGVTVPEHSHIQLGTGTADPFVGLEGVYRTGERWMFVGGAYADVPLYENSDGYRTAPRLTLNLGPALKFGEENPSLFVRLLAEASYASRDRFRGDDIVGPGGTFEGSFGVPNTGRFELTLKPAISGWLSEDLFMDFQLRIPVYTRIREDSDEGDVQLTEQVGLLLAVNYRF